MSALASAAVAGAAAPDTLEGDKNCSEKKKVGFEAQGTATPPVVYWTVCTREDPDGTRGVVRVEAVSAGLTNAKVSWRIELHNCYGGGGERANPPGNSKSDYRQEDIDLHQPGTPELTVLYTSRKSNWYGLGRIMSLAVEAPDGTRWTSGDQGALRDPHGSNFGPFATSEKNSCTNA